MLAPLGMFRLLIPSDCAMVHPSTNLFLQTHARTHTKNKRRITLAYVPPPLTDEQNFDRDACVQDAGGHSDNYGYSDVSLHISCGARGP